MDYLELQAEVADWAHRSDLNIKMDIFVELAESAINKNLRVHEMEIREPILFDDAYIELPVGYLEMRALHVDYNGRRMPLNAISPQQLDVLHSNKSTPTHFAIHGGMIEVRPFGVGSPVNTFTGEITYYQKVPSLIGNPTTDILTNYPLLYLAAMMTQVYFYTQDAEQKQVWEMKFQEQLLLANRATNKGKYLLPEVRNT